MYDFMTQVNRKFQGQGENFRNFVAGKFLYLFSLSYSFLKKNWFCSILQGIPSNRQYSSQLPIRQKMEKIELPIRRKCKKIVLPIRQKKRHIRSEKFKGFAYYYKIFMLLPRRSFLEYVF